MKKNIRVKKLNMAKRLTALGIACVMFFTGAPSKLLTDLVPEEVEATPISGSIIMGVITSSFQGASNLNNFTQEAVEGAIIDQHVDGTPWSSVKLSGVMNVIASGNIRTDTNGDGNIDGNDDNYIYDMDFTRVSDGKAVYWSYTNGAWVGSVEGEDTTYNAEQARDTGIMTRSNPWTTGSSQSEGSPYSPGVDYHNAAMNANYTIGNLIVAYVRDTFPGAVALSDEDIINTYDQLASGDGGTPFPDEDAFLEAMRTLVGAAGIHSIADSATISALNRSRYVTYSQYASGRSTPIPAGTLFIGTWMISAQAINTTFYNMATESMMADDQQIMLYKSELAGNTWKDIYGATGLEDILPIADTVKETDMLDYYVGVVVESDGIPRWARTGQVVDVFTITDPYDLENLPELRALKMLYDSELLDSSDWRKPDYYIKERIRKFYEYDTPFERSATMERDAKYIVEVGGRTGIAFYAPDYRYTYSSTAYAERGRRILWWWHDFISHGSDMGITSTAGNHAWRFEESGLGFLESLEYMAEVGVRRNFDWYYPNGSTFSPNGYADQESKLIRGGPAWANEIAWVNEVNSFGGIQALRQRIWNFQTVWRHFSSVHDEITDAADVQMDSIKNIYFQLRATGSEEDAELADEAMSIQESVDAVRRAEVYYNLSENQNHNYVIGPVLNFLYLQVATGETPIGGCYRGNYYDDYEDFTDNTTISDAVSDAMVQCSRSYITYQSRQLENGSTIISQTRYALSTDVIEKAPLGPAAIREDLRQLVDLTNIEQGVIAHKSRELNLLDILLMTGDAKFQSEVHSSSNDEYRAADADPATTNETKEEILQDQKSDVSGAAGELQRFIKNRAMRLPTDQALQFVLDRIDWAEAQRAGITTDAFGPYAEEALDEHIRWLKDLLAAIKEGGDLEDDGSNLQKKKITLELQLMDALDQGDLEKAEDIRNSISKVDDDIRRNNNNNRAAMNDPNASASDIANVGGLNGPEGVADEIVENALADIGDGDLDPIPDALDALEDIGSPRIPEIVDALNTHGAPEALIHKAEAAAENADKDFLGDDTDIDSGGRGRGSGLGSSDFDDGLGRGNGGDGNSDADDAAALAAITDFANARDDDAAKAYRDDLLQELIDEHCPFLYRQYLPDMEEEYVSLAAVDRASRYTKLRMVDESAAHEVSMAAIDGGGSASYTFRIGGTEVTPNQGDKFNMAKPCVSQEDEYIRGNATAKYPYITESYAEKYLLVGCRYIPGTEWAILVTPQVDRKVAVYLDTLDEKADAD